jgi:hypothetical protein
MCKILAEVPVQFLSLTFFYKTNETEFTEWTLSQVKGEVEFYTESLSDPILYVILQNTQENRLTIPVAESDLQSCNQFLEKEISGIFMFGMRGVALYVLDQLYD